MQVSTLNKAEAIEAVKAETNLDELREAASELDLKFSGNTGIEKLREKILAHLEAEEEEETGAEAFAQAGDEEEIQVAPKKPQTGPSIEDLLNMDETKEADPQMRRLIIRAKALKLTRVQITNLDPGDSPLDGAILTVHSKYTGKVEKYIPFNDDNGVGYHVPQILLDHIKGQKFALRKEIKGRFGVKQYKTSMVSKFSVKELPQITPEELKALAQQQRASNAID